MCASLGSGVVRLSSLTRAAGLERRVGSGCRWISMATVTRPRRSSEVQGEHFQELGVGVLGDS